MIINDKTTVLGTKKKTNALLEQEKSYIEDKKPLAIKISPKLPTLDAQKQVDIYLQKLNRKYCMEFTDYFESIPHAYKLLINIYYYIKLKDLS